MTITKVFQAGNSQAVYIPEEFQFNTTEVEIIRRGEELILREKRDNLSDVLDIFADLPDDFMQQERNKKPPNP